MLRRRCERRANGRETYVQHAQNVAVDVDVVKVSLERPAARELPFSRPLCGPLLEAMEIGVQPIPIKIGHQRYPDGK
jgi:hypothetical protein